MTGKVNSVIAKKRPRPATQLIMQTADRVTQIVFNQLNGQHTQTRLMNPMQVKSMVQSEENSLGVSVVLTSFKITIIIIFKNIKSEQGMDFFKTCGMKFPRITSLLGWKVKMNDGSPIMNISKRSSCFGVKG